MPIIKRLNKKLISLIAAGEVIERPASIVKELLENSIDAQSSNIMINIIEGGIGSVELVDDGVGISQNELTIALERYATSKIFSEKNLESIATLGFRGEGLYSIASIAELSITSRQKDVEYAYKVMSKYGEIKEPEPCNSVVGTRILVENMYHNIPARKKFLKSIYTEYGHCRNVVEHISLAYPDISFSLYNNKKLIFSLPQESVLSRLVNLYGDSYNANYIEVMDNLGSDICITGYLYNSVDMPTKQALQNIYVNKRFVRDRVIQSAIRQALSQVIHSTTQVHYVLFLEIPFSEIDVNVHPTKMEVRFRDTKMLYSFITNALRKCLARPINDTSNRHLINNSTNISHYDTRISPSTPSSYKHNYTVSTSQSNIFPVEHLTELSNMNTNYHKSKEEYIQPKLTIEGGSNILGTAIAQLNSTYILAQSPDGLIVIDMHAAHERILFSELKRQFLLQGVEQQKLLLPIELIFDNDIINILHTRVEQLHKLGFSIECIDNKVIIISTPSLIRMQDINSALRSLLHRVSEFGDDLLLDSHYDTLLSSIACHNSFRVNESLSLVDMNLIINKLGSIPNGNYCNHGRPTWIKYSMSDLDAQFLRGH